MSLVRTISLLAPLLGIVPPAAAQGPEPIGPFVVDVRVVTPGFKEDLIVAEALDVASPTLPGRGLGLAGAVHLYPLRLGGVTLGIGGELLLSRGRRTQESPETGGAAGPTVTTRFSAVSPQLSLNFGARDGWSYLSGGIGTASFTTERQDLPVSAAQGRPSVINYGAGARWFVKRHLAFAFDLRFYAVGPQQPTTGRPPYRRMTMMVLSAGASFR